MSDRTTTHVPTQAVETPDTQAPSTEQSTGVQEQLAQAQADQAEQEEQALAASNRVLKQAIAVYRKGSNAYSRALLECGGLVHQFAVQRMALVAGQGSSASKARANALDLAATELQRVDPMSARVDTHRMVQAYHAWQLLHVAQEHGDQSMAFGHYRDAWATLVERDPATMNTLQESWRLLPGIEQAALEAYAKLVAPKVKATKGECTEVVRGLLVAYHREQAAVHGTAKQLALGEQQAAKQAIAAATTTEERIAAEQAEATAAAKVMAAEQAAAKHAKQAEAVQAKQAEQDAPKQHKSTEPQQPVSKQRTADKATEATPEAWAAMLLGTLLEHPAPEDVLFALMAKAKDECSTKGKRALEMALVAYHRKDSAPVTVTPMNGHAVAAVA